MPDDITLFAITLDRVADTTPQMFVGAMTQSLFDMKSALEPYPPQPARDRAKTFNTYVRGIGRLPKSAFVTKSGATRKKIATKGAARTSQRLGSRWSHRVDISDNTVTGTIENTATYAVFAQGKYQPGYHAETGWVTDEEAYRQQEAQIMRNFNEALDKVVEEMAK